MTHDDTDGLPVRPQQPPPGDIVQQQMRLLVQAVEALRDAVSRTDHKQLLTSGSSVGPTTARAGELAYKVAELGGWVDSLMEVGTHVIDGDDEYLVGKPDGTA